jgi:FkbM family methyltransferase
MLLELTAKALRKVGVAFQKLGNFVGPSESTRPDAPNPQLSEHEARLHKWYTADGDQTLRLGHLELSPDSVVFDLGGYDASFTIEVFARFGCTVYLFEPCRSFFEPIRKRLQHNPRIKLFPYGLGATTRTEQITLNAAGTSMFRTGEATEPIELISVLEFLQREPVDEIHLMKINIEGGEYELLDYLIETGLLQRVRDIQVQFHEDVLPDAEQRMKSIQAGLAKTHQLLWQHEWIWEHWRRRD